MVYWPYNGQSLADANAEGVKMEELWENVKFKDGTKTKGTRLRSATASGYVARGKYEI